MAGRGRVQRDQSVALTPLADVVRTKYRALVRNLKDGDWYSTSVANRKRKPISLTLSLAVGEKLQRLAAKAGKSRSQVVEDLIEAAAVADRTKPKS